MYMHLFVRFFKNEVRETMLKPSEIFPYTKKNDYSLFHKVMPTALGLSR